MGKLEIASLDMCKKRWVKNQASVCKAFLLPLLIKKVWGQDNYWKNQTFKSCRQLQDQRVKFSTSIKHCGLDQLYPLGLKAPLQLHSLLHHVREDRPYHTREPQLMDKDKKLITTFLHSYFQVMILNRNYFKVNCNGACITTAVDLNTQITMTFKKKEVPLEILSTNKKSKIFSWFLGHQ